MAIKDQNGILFTSDLVKFRTPRTYLSILVKKGEIKRVSRGVYSVTDYTIDDMTSLQQVRHKWTIFSHEAAIYLSGLIDWTPFFHSETIPAA